MPLDPAQYIGDLSVIDPGGTDPIAQGDDQIRDFKNAAKQSFPNVKGEVTLDHDQINNLETNVATLYTALLPQGAIMLWSGTTAAIPAGWALCNGQTSNGVVTPNLASKFILGATADGGADPVGENANAPSNATVTSSSNGGHNHGGNTGSTDAPLLQHSHRVFFNGSDTNNDISGDEVALSQRSTGNVGDYRIMGRSNVTPTLSPVSNTGVTDASHAHSISSIADHTHTTTVAYPRPAYYALAYIMFTATPVAPVPYP